MKHFLLAALVVLVMASPAIGQAIPSGQGPIIISGSGGGGIASITGGGCTSSQFVASISAAGAVTCTNFLGVTVAGNGIGVTSTDGWILSNTTAAAVGAQQYSPRHRLTGHAWSTSDAVDRAIDWILENQTSQSIGLGTGFLVGSWQHAKTAGYHSGFAIGQGAFYLYGDASPIGTNATRPPGNAAGQIAFSLDATNAYIWATSNSADSTNLPFHFLTTELIHFETDGTVSTTTAGFKASPMRLNTTTCSTPASLANGDWWIDTTGGTCIAASDTVNLKARTNGVTRTIASVTY